jgi:hypothetical protein
VANADTPTIRGRFVAGGLLAAALVTLLIVVLAGGCGGDGGGKHAQTATSAPTTQVNRPGKPVTLVVGRVDVETAGPAVKLSKDLQKQLLGVAQTYVDTAVHGPISSGKVGDRYGALFEPGVRDAATKRDTQALTDASVGQATKYSEKATPVKISALADNGGTLLYLATNFSLRVAARTDAGQVGITRDVEFTYARTGKVWRVTAYRVRTVRKLPKATTTTTAAAGGGTRP